MSWSYWVAPVPRAEFEAAVDAAVPTGQSVELPGVLDAVESSKESLKLMAKQTKKEMVGGCGSGHCIQDGEVNYSDSVSASVYGA